MKNEKHRQREVAVHGCPWWNDGSEAQASNAFLYFNCLKRRSNQTHRGFALFQQRFFCGVEEEAGAVRRGSLTGAGGGDPFAFPQRLGISLHLRVEMRTCTTSGSSSCSSLVTPQTLLLMIRKYSCARDVGKTIYTFYAYKRFAFEAGMDDFHGLLSA